MPNVHGYRTTSGRRVNARRDPSGQLIIEQDEDNLSDKEMYARNVPAIGKNTIHHSVTRRKCPYTPAATMCHRKGREVIKLPTLWPILTE